MDAINIPGLPSRFISEPEYLSEERLVGIDGNAYSIMGVVQRGLRKAGAPRDYIARVMNEMQAGDYDNLLAVASRYTKGGGF